MSRSRERQIGNVTFRRNRQLGYTYYRVDKDSGNQSAEIYLSDEFRNNAGVPFKKLKELMVFECNRVTNNPFGETNIDPHVSNPEAQSERVVNRLSAAVQEQIDLPVAIKSLPPTGPGVLKDLRGQFRVMRELQKAAEKRLGELGSILELLPVYGAVRFNNQQFLLMKYIPGAYEMEDIPVSGANYGWMGGGDSHESAFKTSKHIEFVRALDLSTGHSTVSWKAVEGKIQDRLGKPLGDLAGRNVLCYGEGQARRYAVIDQIKKGTYI